MSIVDEPLDVLESGAEPDPGRRAAVAVILALTLLLLAGVGYLDLRSRHAEFAALTRCAARGASEVTDATARVSAMAEYARPALSFATEHTADGLYRLIASEAQAPAPGLQQARDGCSAVGVHRWHDALGAARRVQIAYLDGVLARRAETAQNGRAFFEEEPAQYPVAAEARAGLAAARPPFS